MAHLSLDLLGTFAATLDGRAVRSFRSNKTRALLAYLAVEADRPHARSTLAALFWPDTPDAVAASNLRLTLHRLREALDGAAAGVADTILHASGGQLQINGTALTLDVAVFTDALAEVSAHSHGEPQPCPACRQRLQQAVALYRGELLAGFGLKDAPLFEEWLLVQRERLAYQCILALHTLAAACEAMGDYESMLVCAARQAALDPFREAAYRQAMAALALSGRRSEAVAWYQTCVRVLADELGIEPDHETTALYRRINSGAVIQQARPALRVVGFSAQLVPFVGREAELAAIRERLLDPACRLLTLTGLGGMGKTRLAVEAARSMADQPADASARFTDGIFFVPLASAGSAELLPTALATALGLALHDGASMGDQVIDFLRHKRTLLVLDNFEHLRDGALWLHSVLEAAPAVEMLVTSRLPLDLVAEERMRLDGLGYPGPGVAVDEATTYPAVMLFAQAARRVQHSFRVSPPNVEDVIRICALVDGRPLALEIAASWLRVYDCAGIVREIQRSFSFLATQQHDVPLRQRSIQTVFDHTRELLSPAQQQALADLAVFRGAFQLEAALAVSKASVVDVAALLDASLVQRRADGWYEIHILLRQFALQYAQEPGPGDQAFHQARRRHSEYHLAYLAAQEPALAGPEPRVAVAQIKRRLDDIRQAWRLAGERGWCDGLARSLDGLARFYDSSGLIQEGDEVLARTAGQLRHLGASESASSLQVAGLLSRLLTWQAYFLDRRGQGLAAIDLLQQAMPLAEQSGDAVAQSECHSLLGALLPHRGEWVLAQQHQEQAVAAFRARDDQRRLAVALTRLGIMHWRRGNSGLAETYLQEALTLQQRVQNRLGMAKVLQVMGGIAFGQQKFDQALAHAQEAREIYATVGDRSSVAALDGNLALLSQVRGNYEEALAYNQQDLDYVVEMGDRHGEAVALGNRAHILLDAGRLDAALACLAKAMGIQETLANAWEVARLRASIAGILAWRNRRDEALAEYQRALPTLRSHGAPYFLVGPLLSAAELMVDTGALSAARELAQEGGRLAEELGIADWVLWSHILEARLDHAEGCVQDALAQLHGLAEQAEDPAQQASVYFWLWKMDQAEADRDAAERLYEELHAARPKYEYTMCLEALRRQAP